MCQDEKTTVNLRIEGKTGTIFERDVNTCGHRVTTATGRTHHCNGTNNDANPCAGPTCITALDDGNKLARFGFDGEFNDRFDDFIIRTIANETPPRPPPPTNKDFWALCLNFLPTAVGGCQQKVKKGDQVLFAYATAGVTLHYLRLFGPGIAIVGTPTVLTVTDGTGAPISGATVGGLQTDAQGRVSITFTTPGTRYLKAERRTNSVRSNQLVIQVIVGA